MKKRILLLLAAVLCVSLCACGGSETSSGNNTDMQKEESGGLFKTEQEIEITMDNWQEYFEFKDGIKDVTIEKNAFDEIETVIVRSDVIFCLKEEYKDKFISVDIALEYIPHMPEVKLFTYNYVEDSFEIDELDENVNENEWTGLIDSHPHMNEKETIEITNSSQVLHLSHSSSQGRNGDIVTLYGTVFPDLEVTRIQGTLVIKE